MDGGPRIVGPGCICSWHSFDQKNVTWQTRGPTEWESDHFLLPTRGHNWPFRCLDLHKGLHGICQGGIVRILSIWSESLSIFSLVLGLGKVHKKFCPFYSYENSAKILFLKEPDYNAVFRNWSRLQVNTGNDGHCWAFISLFDSAIQAPGEQ